MQLLVSSYTAIIGNKNMQFVGTIGWKTEFYDEKSVSEHILG